jgi:hypothetical protein
MNFRNKLLFVLGMPFQPSLTFVRKAGAYPSGAPKRTLYRTLYGRLLALLANNRLGWKGLPGQTLAYYEY